MEFRRITSKDREQIENLWAYCFEKKEEPFFQYYFQHYCYEQNVVWGAFAGDKLQSMLHLNPYAMSLRGKEQQVPYIVGVATAEEARGKHLMGELLQASLVDLSKQKLDFVYLMPIYAGIYLPYGFAFCYERLKYSWEKGKLSLTQAQKHNAELRLVQGNICLEEAGSWKTALAELYDGYTESLQGAPKRRAKDWQKLLGVYEGDGFSYAIAYKGEQAVGYLLYGLADGCLNLVELISTDAEIKLALLKYADKLEIKAERCEWLAEAWDKTYLSLADAAQAPQKLPFMMARCLNVTRALQGLQVAQHVSGSVVLWVKDELLPHNSCAVALSCHEGVLQAEPLSVAAHAEGACVCKDCSVDIAMDIAAFTQLYFGLTNATELWEAGRLQLLDSKNLSKLQVLDALFPKTRNWVNEYY